MNRGGCSEWWSTFLFTRTSHEEILFAVKALLHSTRHLLQHGILQKRTLLDNDSGQWSEARAKQQESLDPVMRSTISDRSHCNSHKRPYKSPRDWWAFPLTVAWNFATNLYIRHQYNSRAEMQKCKTSKYRSWDVSMIRKALRTWVFQTQYYRKCQERVPSCFQLSSSDTKSKVASMSDLLTLGKEQNMPVHSEQKLSGYEEGGAHNFPTLARR